MAQGHVDVVLSGGGGVQWRASQLDSCEGIMALASMAWQRGGRERAAQEQLYESQEKCVCAVDEVCSSRVVTKAIRRGGKPP